MAQSEASPSAETVKVEPKKLKYLDFVQVAVVYVVVRLSALYEYAKDNCGPLKSGVETVEGTVRAVIGPVYDKLHGVPVELLYFVDRKVDELITTVERHVPSLIKQASSEARALASEARRDGAVDTARNIAKKVYTKYEPTAEEYYSKYEPLAEQYAVLAWRSLNRLTLYPQAARILVPAAAYWSDKYNQAVAYLAEKGYKVSSYLPLIPVERIAMVFEGAETVSTNDESVAAVQED